MAPSAFSLIIRRLLPRTPTPAEVQEREAQRVLAAQQRALTAQLEAEARACARVIADTLADLGVCYRYRKSERDPLEGRVQKVRFHRDFLVTEEAIYLPVDLSPGKRPRGVGIEHLCDDNVIRNLGGNIGRKVSYHYSEEDGFVYIVYRQTGVGAIPTHVKYDDAIALRPPSASDLHIPIGMTTGKRMIWRSIGEMVSMLVAGTTGGGKSNFLRVLICTLVNQNSPRRLRIGLIDLKRGVEFAPFIRLPHVLHFRGSAGDDQTAMIDRRDEVIPFLQWMVAEGERRLDLIREQGVQNIGQYNSRKGRMRPLPYIVLIIDEWADIKLEPKIGSAAQELLINVASRFRAAGISVVCCTQYPQKEVVSMRLKAVMPAKLAMPMPNVHASVMVLNNDKAFGIGTKGRGVFQWGAEEHEVQIPFINSDTVMQIVERAMRGDHYKAELGGKHDVTPEEIFEWAINHNAGKLDWRSLFSQFRGRGFTADNARQFPNEFADQVVVVGASPYRVHRPTGYGQAWRLLPVDDHEHDAETEPAIVAPSPSIRPEEFRPDPAIRLETYTDVTALEDLLEQEHGTAEQAEPDYLRVNGSGESEGDEDA
jgi:hypothetical protein